MTQLTYFLIWLAFVSSVQLAAAQSILKEAGLSYRLPPGWALQASRMGNRSCWVAVGPDTSISVQLCLWNDVGELGETFDEAVAEWNLTGPGDEGPADVDLNGMEAVLAEVSENADEGDSGLLLVCLPSETLRVVVVGLYPDDYAPGEELLRSFIGSLQPLTNVGDSGDDGGDNSDEGLDDDSDEDVLSGDF